MPQALQSSIIGRVNNLIAELSAEKQASELGTSGSASADPGGHRGQSSHPSADADAGTRSAPMGSRAKENEADVKKQHPGSGVDNVTGTGPSQDSRQLNIGTEQAATGEAPSVEDNYKGDKDDPGTSHPANAEEVGEKYAAMSFNALVKLAYDQMNECLADIANGAAVENKKTAAASNSTTSNQAAQAAQAGYELAELAGRTTNDEQEKLAFVQAMVEQTILDASGDADLVGQWLGRYNVAREQLQKSAEGEMPPGGMPGMPPGGGGGEMPPDIMAAMAGGMPPGGGEMPPGAGEMPPGGGGGELPPEAAAGEGGGGEVDVESAVNELANALIEAGIPPEELLAAVEAEAGGAGGAGGAGEGAAPPTPEAKMAAARRQKIGRENCVKLAQWARAAANHQRSGKLRLKEAGPGTKHRRDRDEVIGYIREVCGRS